MEDLDIVECLQPAHNLYENLPYHIFWDVLLLLLMPRYLLEKIAVIRVLHDNTSKKKKIIKLSYES